VVTDALPPGYSYVPGTMTGGSSQNQSGAPNLSWTVARIAKDATVTMQFVALLVGNRASGQDYTNYAQITASGQPDPDSTPGDNSTSEDDNASAAPSISDLSLGKTIALAAGGDLNGNGRIDAGDTVTFTLTVSNAGPAAANGVSVTDSMPAGYSNISANSNGGSLNAGTITWSGLNVAASGTSQVTFKTVVAAGQAASAYRNYAQIASSPNFDPDSTPGNSGSSPGEDDDDATRPVISDLSLSKTVALTVDADGNGAITVGDSVTYTLSVTNGGPDTATNVEVTDRLPTGTRYLSSNGAGVYDPLTGVWTIGSLSNGSVATLNLLTLVTGSGNYFNRAEATGNSSLDPDSTPGNGNPSEDDYGTATFPSPLPAVIGNQVWLDENGDGRQDAGEPGLPGLIVTLRNSQGAVVATTVTDVQGRYVFAHVAPGDYSVTVAPPAGLNPTYDPNGIGSPNTTSITVVAGQESPENDFGYNWTPPGDSANPAPTAPGAIGDQPWIDANGDGRQQSNEPGLAGVSVGLYRDSDGNGTYETLAAVVNTDGSGRYIFTGLAPGAYVIAVNGGITPFGYTQTGDPDSTLDNRSSPLILAPGDVYVNADFGYRPQADQGAPVGDRVWLDANADGIQGAGEPGIAGVTVSLARDLNNNGV
ncbi:MAG TPA: SdrD B-like domain-containing protein, partial [Pirellulaceae bacterium]|nr:SdrD B-like domain-containing protein [Pirellulaceae bacterium]